MPLLWYRDDQDGLLKPFAIPGDDLSSSAFVVTGQQVAAGNGWTALGAATVPPTGDHFVAFTPGKWTCPTAGTWVLEFHVSVDETVGVGAKIEGLGTARGSSSPSVGVGVAWLFEGEVGQEFNFFVRHGAGSAQAVQSRITATRLRSFSPGGVRSREVSEWVAKAGDTMLGPLVLAGDPNEPLDAATKQFVDGKVVNQWGGGAANRAPSQAAVEGALGGLSGRVVEAGAGLIGGGRLDSDPWLGVGAGWGVSVGSDSVSVDSNVIASRESMEGRVPRGSAHVSDWNAATENGYYTASGAANEPSGAGGWWMAHVVNHHGGWVTQTAWPMNQGEVDSAMEMRRASRNGAWGNWYRPANRCYAWNTMDNFFYFNHGGSSLPGGPGPHRVWAIGNKKDAGQWAVTPNEQFRIQRYDTSGVYAGNLMTGTMAGHVAFPGGHARTVEAKASGDPIPADTAATIGVVADMILTALVRLDLIPRTRVADVAGVVGLVLAEASNEYDPTSARDEELT
jgi:hypothetical protein